MSIISFKRIFSRVYDHDWTSMSRQLKNFNSLPRHLSIIFQIISNEKIKYIKGEKIKSIYYIFQNKKQTMIYNTLYIHITITHFIKKKRYWSSFCIYCHFILRAEKRVHLYSAIWLWLLQIYICFIFLLCNECE